MEKCFTFKNMLNHINIENTDILGNPKTTIDFVKQSTQQFCILFMLKYIDYTI